MKKKAKVKKGQTWKKDKLEKILEKIGQRTKYENCKVEKGQNWAKRTKLNKNRRQSWTIFKQLGKVGWNEQKLTSLTNVEEDKKIDIQKRGMMLALKKKISMIDFTNLFCRKAVKIVRISRISGDIQA